MNEQWVTCGQENPDLDVLSESALAMAQATLQNAMDESKVSRAALARRMDAPRSFITRMLSGSHNLTIKTMARCLAACGHEIQFGVKPIQWNWVSAEPKQIVVECRTVPSLEGTLLPTNFDSLVAGCALGI